MRTAKINTTILNNYFGLLQNLSPTIKLALIEKLLKSINKDLGKNINSMKKAFGAWKSEKSADEIIKEIRDSRSFTRKIEEF